MAHPTDARFWQVPRLRAERRWLGGVAAAIALEVGVEPLWVRVAFVLLTLSGGIGLALYAASWLGCTFYALAHRAEAYAPVPKAATPARRTLGFALVVCGMLWLAYRLVGFGVAEAALWPAAVSSFGMLLAWSSGRLDGSAPRELLRAVGGLSLVAVGVIAFIALHFGVASAPGALLISTAVLSLVVLIVAPWLWRAASQVSEERLKRTRADARAELAAHLHDSVLQTLSLIQRNADDKQATLSLARRQERELREWLFGRAHDASEEQRFRTSLEKLAAEVEELHGVPVEVVVVGDAPLDERLASALSAAREALVNAARHSGAPRVDVYGELGPDRLEIFVRDTGRGFASAAVPADRRGLRDSVLGRMERAGGSASIVSAPGHGCEVALSLPLRSPV